jgi:hypothetical protein
MARVSLPFGEDHVEGGPSPGLSARSLHLHGGSIAKQVAEGIRNVNHPISVLQGCNAGLSKAGNFIGLADAVSVPIIPDAEGGEDRIPRINLSVTVTAGFRLIKLGNRTVADLRRLAGEKRRRIAEQLGSVVDPPVVVPIQAEKDVVAARSGPGDLVGDAVCINIEADRWSPDGGRGGLGMSPPGRSPPKAVLLLAYPISERIVALKMRRPS